MRGKKVAITSDHIERIVQALLVGGTYEIAALYAGVSEDTLARWRKKAVHAAPDSLLGQLRDRMMEAEGRAAVGWLAVIEKASRSGDWKAAAWQISHRYVETYGRTLNKLAFTDPTGERDGTLTLKVVYEDAIDVAPTPPRLEPPP